MTFVANSTFGTALSCIDGRVHLPLMSWMREVLSVQYVDLITHPGADAFLANEPQRAAQLLRPGVDISVGRHASHVLAIAAHHDCAANPVDAASHRDHLLRAVQAVLAWNLGVKVVALWVNPDWRIDVVQTRSADAAAR